MNGDQEMISLTVQNLVENAVKYNRPGGKILVSAEKHDHVVQICVGNSGPGIPPERAPNIFERFYRARGDEQTPGHGLGLSIARELARAHGGDLTLSQSAIGLDRILFTTERLEHPRANAKTASSDSRVARHIRDCAVRRLPFQRVEKEEAG